MKSSLKVAILLKIHQIVFGRKI